MTTYFKEETSRLFKEILDNSPMVRTPLTDEDLIRFIFQTYPNIRLQTHFNIINSSQYPEISKWFFTKSLNENKPVDFETFSTYFIQEKQLEPTIVDYHDLLTQYQQISQNGNRYSYDMTKYINNLQLRYQDSLTFAKIFTTEFDKFVATHEPDSNYVDLPFKDAFHGARRAFQFLHSPEDIFSFYFKLGKIVEPDCVPRLLKTSLQYVVPFFSHMKHFIHTHFDQLPPIAYMYAELDTIAGYPLQQYRALNDDPYKWLTEDVDDQHGAEWWSQQIQTLLYKSAHMSSKMLISFTQFVESPWLWVTNGATTVSKLVLDGQKVGTKFGAAVSLTSQELIDQVLHSLNPKVANIDIFIKPDERGFKRRLIANMDMGSYLIAAYIRYLIEYIDGPNPQWMTATTGPFLDAQVSNLLKQNQRSIPLDESAFDHHLSRNAWLGLIDALEHIFPHNFGVTLFNLLFHNSIYHDRESDTKGPWYKGMPSGLAITAIGNTIFNYIKQQTIESPVHFALGDDVLVFNEKIQLKDLEKYYSTFGAEVNANKNWESRKYAEYLHFLYTKHGRVGYPSRVYGSLIYALQFKDTSPLQRINELTQLFKDFFDRACVEFDFHLVAADLSRAVSSRWAGFSARVAEQWLHIPKALNGYGFLPYNNLGFTVVNDDIKEKYYSGQRIRLPRKIEIVKSHFKLYKYKLKDVTYHTGNELHLPPIENFEDWERMLNFDYPQYTHTEIKYASGPIPLPEMPYISTSRMSAFAERFKFNAYPNCHGNEITRTSRFILASLALSRIVSQFMIANDWLVYV